ncbi:MAG: precorrin-6y C5,15-methyltransferase (decarboxylating) subunit CbiE [Phormidesmis sp.]
MSGSLPINVVGIGLSGAKSLSPPVLDIVTAATLLIGAQRHLEAIGSAIKTTVGQAASRTDLETWVLGDFGQVFEDLRLYLESTPEARVVILATGDPLFFGIGRLLLSTFPAEQLIFHPQVSAIQLAFSRLKLPWQDATLVSVHGRGEDLLRDALKRGDHKIAVLTDSVLTPGAIARLLSALELPIRYQLWVCESLGDRDEQVRRYDRVTDDSTTFAALNVVVLLRQSDEAEASLTASPRQASSEALPLLPLIGLPDSVFKGYADRPMLMTKREIRLLILGAIAPLDHQTIWDVGAGTGSISVELSRLCPHASIYAIEKTAMGAALIAENARRLAIAPIHTVHAKAPEAFDNLPHPDRIFIGGSSGQLSNILNWLYKKLTVSKLSISRDTPRIVLALATLEHLAEVTTWVNQPEIAKVWQIQLTQANISRSLPVGPLTRFTPLNPVTILTISKIGRLFRDLR